MSVASLSMYQMIKHSYESLWPEHEDDKFETAYEVSVIFLAILLSCCDCRSHIGFSSAVI